MADGDVDVVDMNDLNQLGEDAGDSSQEVCNTLSELSSASEAEATTLEATLESKVTETLSKMQTSLGLSEPITVEMLENASLDDPPDDDAKILKNFFEKFQDFLRSKIADIQAKNGETGKSIEDSPKTQQSIFDKYGADALRLAMMIGALAAGYVLLKDMGDSMSGCYQTLTCSSNQSAPSKVGCSESNCSCSGVKSSGCAEPTCDNPKANGCPNYYWQHFSLLQALTTIPNAILNGLLQPLESGISSLIKTIAIYGGISIGILLILFIIYKVVMVVMSITSKK